ncbi:MAG: TRAP transporter large permease subunit [Acidobacteriota bacterium]|nr:TRAP transporter large permease subunit [Acidobacteriota bacterium]
MKQVEGVETAGRGRLKRWEDAVSVTALLLMAVIPLAEILIRKVYTRGIPGAALWVQHLVLLVGFLGAALAAREGELLSLTAPGKSGEGLKQRIRNTFVAGTLLAISLSLAWGGWVFALAEREGGRMLALGVPVWIIEMVIPLGLVLVGLRFWWQTAAKLPERLIAAVFPVIPWLLSLHEAPDESGLTWPLITLIVVATALGLPIFAALGGLAAVLLWQNYDPISAIALEAYNLSIKPMLPTIPLFTLAGFILAEGGTPKRLVALFRAFFGWLPGGVAVVAIFVCAFFTSFTGGSGVTILAMGGLMFPMLTQDGQTQRFTTGLLTSAGSLGLLFPPSLAIILYAMVAELDVKHLFLAGMTPGVLEITMVALFVYFSSRKSGIQKQAFIWRDAVRALWDAKWETAIPLVVLGSILGGLTTLVEAAALTVLYAFFLEFIIRRDLSVRRDLVRVAGKASVLIGAVLIILGIALGLTNYLVFADIPGQALEKVQAVVAEPLVFLLMFNLFLILVGCVMDIFSAVVVVVPLVAPLGQHYGIDPYHMGIIFLVNLELGYMTPPVGMNLFLASHRFRVSLPEVYRAALPFLAIRAGAVLLVTYVPYLTSFLPAIFL